MEELLSLDIYTDYTWSSRITQCVDSITLIAAVITVVLFVVPFFNDRKRIRPWAILPLAICLLASINFITKDFSQPNIDSDYLGEIIYFGQASNNLPDGNGRIFDKDKYIVYRGEFQQGKYNGKGTSYSTYRDSDTTKSYLEYDGSWKDGQFNGTGKYYSLYNGEPVITYEGDYLLGQRNGSGTEYSYKRKDDNNHEIYCSAMYIGSWAYDKKYGYGIYTVFDASGTPIKRYRGTWWSNEFWGKGIWEFIDEGDGNHGKVIYHGQFRNGEPAVEGCWYKVGNSEPLMQGAIDENGNFDGTDIRDKYPYPNKNDSLWW